MHDIMRQAAGMFSTDIVAKTYLNETVHHIYSTSTSRATTTQEEVLSLDILS